MEKRYCDQSKKFKKKYIKAFVGLYKCHDKANLEAKVNTSNLLNTKLAGKDKDSL